MLTLLKNLSVLATAIITLINRILVITDSMEEDDTTLEETNTAVTDFLNALQGLNLGDSAQ